jgi:hypothetical protein
VRHLHQASGITGAELGERGHATANDRRNSSTTYGWCTRRRGPPCTHSTRRGATYKYCLANAGADASAAKNGGNLRALWGGLIDVLKTLTYL